MMKDTYDDRLLEVVGKAQIEERVVPHRVVEIRFVHAEKHNRFRTHGPRIGEAPAEFERQRARGAGHVSEITSGYLGAQDIIESETRAEEKVVLERVRRTAWGCVAASPVVVRIPGHRERRFQPKVNIHSKAS